MVNIVQHNMRRFVDSVQVNEQVYLNETLLSETISIDCIIYRI